MTDSRRPHRLLVVEDDRPTRAFLCDNLLADGYDAVAADSASIAVRRLELQPYDLVILDRALGDSSGLDVLRAVRSADGLASRIDPVTPVLVLSGSCTELDRLRAFDAGADDFLAKPFSYHELRLRAAAVLRRTRSDRTTGRVQIGTMELDPTSRTVTVGGRVVALSTKEYTLLRTLASDPTRVWTKEELLRDVWGFKALGSTRTLDSHACRLRKKLADAGAGLVVNVWGVGYRLVDTPSAVAA